MTKALARKTLAALFERGGCFRTVDLKARKRLGEKYKHGYEVRIACKTQREVQSVRSSLRALGLHNGTPYAKAKQTIVPVYGREQVSALCRALGYYDVTGSGTE